MERRLSAILAADVAGYSRLMEADETATLAAHYARNKIDRPFEDLGRKTVKNISEPVRAYRVRAGFEHGAGIASRLNQALRKVGFDDRW